MKNSIFICCILIILFKTGNVLSDTNIFNVNNVEISKETYKNKEKGRDLTYINYKTIYYKISLIIAKPPIKSTVKSIANKLK